MRKNMKVASLMGLFVGLLASVGTVAQQDFSQVEFSTQPVVEGLVMLQGAGGNVGVFVPQKGLEGQDGLLIIDDDYEAMGTKLAASLQALSHSPARFVLNTHWHFDHAGSNPVLGRDGAIIVAHDNVRQRLQRGGTIAAFNAVIPPADRSALPLVTYSDSMTLHWNGLTLELDHPNPAHTDGDSVVYISRAGQLQAVHTGDLFFNGFYPFIDASSGGSAMGMVTAVADVLSKIDDSTKIIPGHGPLGSKRDLQAYHDFLKTAVSRIAALKAQGKSQTEVVAAKPVADFEAEWGDGFLQTDLWVGIVYGAL